MGLFGITEGAIPFAAQDPIRVIPSIVTGSVVGAVIAMLFNVGDRVAHGGPIVAVLGAVDNVFMFFVAAIIGSFVTAFMVIALKKNVGEQPALATAGGGIVPEVETASDVSTVEIKPEEKQEEGNDLEIHKLTDITSLDLIETNLKGNTQETIIDEMIEKLDLAGVLDSKEDFKKAILKREAESTTGLGMGIAIPHGKSTAVKRPAVVFGIKRTGIDWKSLDGSDAKLIFMIAVPEEANGNAHLKILQMLSRKLMDHDFREQLLEVTEKEDALKLLDTIE